MIEREYNFSDVYLRPQKCIVKSREECDISVALGENRFSNPVIAANMKSVVDADTCKYLHDNKMFYIYHRFNNDNYEFAKEMKDSGRIVSISIGVKQEDKDLIRKLCDNYYCPDYITIDIAHGHADSVASMINFLKIMCNDSFIIAGNVATAEGVQFLQEAGASGVKCGIAQGSVCTTRIKTGFTRGMVSCIAECAEVAKIPIISDGGIYTPGDIAKAIAAGATMVMCGSFMSGYDQNSGQVVTIDGKKKYVYYGSASFNNKGHKSHVEGKEILLDYKGNMDDHIYDIECSLKSATSYAGKNTLQEIKGTPLFAIN
jgi:GMP reductase